uniref:Uncharacterized protein n=1 Tax=Trichuris muris TaxID=70415 RepID=A0A5S6QVE1_TRIMR
MSDIAISLFDFWKRTYKRLAKISDTNLQTAIVCLEFGIRRVFPTKAAPGQTQISSRTYAFVSDKIRHQSNLARTLIRKDAAQHPQPHS